MKRINTTYLFAAIVLAGCSGGAGDEGKEMTTAEMDALKTEQLANSGMPPEAKAAMEASGRYGGGGDGYGKGQEQAQGKGGK